MIQCNIFRPDIATTCVGLAASMGAVLLSSGTAGKRVSLPNARIMIHQPSGGFQGSAVDIGIQAEEVLKTKRKLNEILAHHSGKPIEQIEKDTDRDYFMSAEEAMNYGLIDNVLVKRDGKKK